MAKKRPAPPEDAPPQDDAGNIHERRKTREAERQREQARAGNNIPPAPRRLAADAAAVSLAAGEWSPGL
jgi:hypothetical protein